jgi:hypothetical protein
MVGNLCSYVNHQKMHYCSYLHHHDNDEMHQVPMQHIFFYFFAFDLIIEMNHFIQNQSYALEPHQI